ncbi:WD40/YVTN/BNR-like repeat-containing protein [Kaistella carnis]|uniref:WD40/YVTN/BNR-like repeat-containing protein n=1 Tax=Kaistella carnis TaxID=1241979 RepID=UPI00289F345E|nr:glycosyl hydrolase [Kaistella carnis]
MKKSFSLLLFLFCLSFSFAQKVDFQTVLKDKISIRALQIYDEKVWYSGTDSKFGFVSLKDSTDKKQMRLSEKNLQFRTLAQNKTDFYAVNIESPAYFFKIDKKSLKYEIVFTDTAKTAFYDALHFSKDGFGFALSDPNGKESATSSLKIGSKFWQKCKGNCLPEFKIGEAAFAASNTNIASSKKHMWFATGGLYSRIFRQNIKSRTWEVFETPFIQGTSSRGIYSIDFYDDQFGIAVGGDYTKQAENINNIATTNDGGKTWQIQASGKNGGYKTYVKFRPKSKGKDIIAVGDQNIEFSNDYGKTWTTISEEKGLYVCEWIDQNTLVFAGKNRIIKMKVNNNF